MEIFLDDHVAAAGERGILLTDEGSLDRCLSSRVFGPVDEPEKIAIVEITKAMHLIDGRDRVAEARHHLRGNFETEVHAFRTDMEKQVSWRRDCVARSRPNLTEGVKFGRAWVPEQPVPRLGTDTQNARQATFEIAKLHSAKYCREVCAKRPHGGTMVRARIYCCDQEDRNTGKWSGYGLRNDKHALTVFRHSHWIAVTEPLAVN